MSLIGLGSLAEVLVLGSRLEEAGSLLVGSLLCESQWKGPLVRWVLVAYAVGHQVESLLAEGSQL